MQETLEKILKAEEEVKNSEIQAEEDAKKLISEGEKKAKQIVFDAEERAKEEAAALKERALKDAEDYINKKAFEAKQKAEELEKSTESLKEKAILKITEYLTE